MSVIQSQSCVHSLQLHGLQHARLPCPSLSPRVCLNSCPLSWWYHPTISFSVAPFFCPQSFPISGSFPKSWLSASVSQSVGYIASISVLPMNIQGSFSSGLTGLISLSKGLSRIFSSTTVWKYQFFSAHPSLWSNSHIIHDYWKNHRFDYMGPLSGNQGASVF